MSVTVAASGGSPKGRGGGSEAGQVDMASKGKRLGLEGAHRGLEEGRAPGAGRGWCRQIVMPAQRWKVAADREMVARVLDRRGALVDDDLTQKKEATHVLVIGQAGTNGDGKGGF